MYANVCKCMQMKVKTPSEQNKKVTNLNVNVCFEMHKLMLNMLCFCLLFGFLQFN